MAIWRRFGAWLGMLAVFAALWAPVSLLAHDVQNGKLGSLCSAASKGLVEKNAESQDDSDRLSTEHCQACVASVFALPPVALGLQSLANGPDALAGAVPPGLANEAVPGLPFSRGPPAL